MKKEKKQKPYFTNGFWGATRPEVSNEETFKDVSKINWNIKSKSTSGEKQVLIRSVQEIKSNL